MSIELLKSISTQKAHKTCYKQGSILHYLGTNQQAIWPLEQFSDKGKEEILMWSIMQARH